MEFLSALDTPAGGERQLQRLADSQTENGHHYKGFNLFAAADAQVFRLLLRGEFAISGLTARALRTLMPDKTSGQVSRLLKRLRVHGLLKTHRPTPASGGGHGQIGLRYKYYLTDFGRQVLTLALTLREQRAVPALARA
ncbi:hypothetical protein ANRL4_01821 [Anaerolineae bacterium]|nr:hypothetical protein ANRL4_01821 [Anaerolineae bacterium]